ncbi:MAG: hypothetical protein H0X52_06095 [Gemmatimonadetes bacterium]|nr:hypothetical protein [Gemmatimonadota bacterium]
MPSAAEIFARTVIALELYAGDVVFVGGWVHALYLADANADERPVVTDDIDLSIPHRLLAGDDASVGRGSCTAPPGHMAGKMRPACLPFAVHLAAWRSKRIVRTTRTWATVEPAACLEVRQELGMPLEVEVHEVEVAV